MLLIDACICPRLFNALIVTAIAEMCTEIQEAVLDGRIDEVRSYLLLQV